MQDGEEFVLDEDICEMQELSKEIKTLKEALNSKKDVTDWPQELQSYKRFANSIIQIDQALYFMNGGRDTDENFI